MFRKHEIRYWMLWYRSKISPTPRQFWVFMMFYDKTPYHLIFIKAKGVWSSWIWASVHCLLPINITRFNGFKNNHYNTPMWYFGPCVTFRPWQCHFLDLPMWLFGPAAFPCQWHPLPRIIKIYRNRLKVKRDNKINSNYTNNRRNTQTQEPRCFLVSSTYSLGSSFRNIWKRNGALSMYGTGC